MAALAAGLGGVGGVAGEEDRHRLDELVGTVGGGIGPAFGLVSVEDEMMRAGQTRRGAGRRLEGRPVLAGNEQHLLGNLAEWRRIEPHRGDADDAAEPLRVCGGKPGDVGRDLAGDMGAGDAQMVEQRGKPRCRRQLMLRQRLPSVLRSPRAGRRGLTL
jgi:hypothetical protein